MSLHTESPINFPHGNDYSRYNGLSVNYKSMRRLPRASGSNPRDRKVCCHPARTAAVQSRRGAGASSG